MTHCVLNCGRPAEGVCHPCLTDLTDLLTQIPDLIPELETAVTRQARFGGSSVGYVTGATERTIPPNLAAAHVAQHLRDTLAHWVHRLCQVEQHGHVVDIAIHPIPLSRWLLRHPTWIAGHPQAPDLFTQITSAIHRAMNITDRPVDKVFLGICEVVDDEQGMVDPCGVWLYGLPGRVEVTCGGCGWIHTVQYSRERLLAQLDDKLLTATEISRALPSHLGVNVTASMIRNFAVRGRLVPHGEALSEDQKRVPRYRVGDVLDLLASGVDSEEWADYPTLAGELGVAVGTLRRWGSMDGWETKPAPPGGARRLYRRADALASHERYRGPLLGETG